MRKIMPLFITYPELESILGPEHHGKQNSKESFNEQIPKSLLLLVMAINYYVLMTSSVSLLRQRYLGKDTVCTFINMIKEIKYCSDMMKNILTKNF